MGDLNTIRCLLIIIMKNHFFIGNSVPGMENLGFTRRLKIDNKLQWLRSGPRVILPVTHVLLIFSRTWEIQWSCPSDFYCLPQIHPTSATAGQMAISYMHIHKHWEQFADGIKNIRKVPTIVNAFKLGVLRRFIVTVQTWHVLGHGKPISVRERNSVTGREIEQNPETWKKLKVWRKIQYGKQTNKNKSPSRQHVVRR